MATRSKSSKTPTGALDHLLTNVLVAAADSPLRSAMKAAGATDILDFMSLTKSDLISLTWQTPGDAPTLACLNLADCNKLVTVQEWYQSQPTPSIETWFTLTTEIFQTYRMNKVSNPASNVTVSAVGTSLPELVPASSDADVEASFLKGTKRSISDYKAFKYAKQLNSWGHHLPATAAAHGISDVFKPINESTTPSVKEIFKHAQAFAFSVLTTCVQEPGSQTLV